MLARVGHRVSAVLVGVAAVAWPVAHIGDIAALAVAVNVPLAAGFVPLARPNPRRPHPGTADAPCSDWMFGPDRSVVWTGTASRCSPPLLGLAHRGPPIGDQIGGFSAMTSTGSMVGRANRTPVLSAIARATLPERWVWRPESSGNAS